MADGGVIRVTVTYSPAPREVREQVVTVPSASTVADALQASGVPLPHGAAVGVWGRKARIDHVLREADRIEIYRPLRVDPKLARRERFHQQGARAAGLFALNRSKSGSD
jgi:putative ubiquitin-RnfH superfamily antitoxin RatB of RatAB toxin-antitoxin module